MQSLICFFITFPGLLFERFTVNCFNLMKNILLSDTYKPGKHEIGMYKESAEYITRDLTRILKTGVRDSSKRKSRSPRQNLGVPL